MSRKIWLIRHAMPDIPLGERWCVGGRSNFPLGRLGKLQAALLPFLPELQGLGAVFCSSLLRARETALPLCPAPREMPGLQEQDMGLWDGLSFREIRQRYPALYAARERDPALLPQGAESVEAVRRRMTEGILRCLRESEGTIAIVSHKGSIASITGQREKLGYTSLTLLEAEREELRVLSVGQAPHPALTEEVCRALMHAAGAEARIAHCRAVAELAEELRKALADKGLPLDRDTLRAAALLHDIARDLPEHAAVGALWLRELGYPAVADCVRQHHDPDSTALGEAALLYLADKAVRGGERVSVEERFAASLGKCKTPEALAAHRRRLEAAREILKNIKTVCGEQSFPEL